MTPIKRVAVQPFFGAIETPWFPAAKKNSTLKYVSDKYASSDGLVRQGRELTERAYVERRHDVPVKVLSADLGHGRVDQYVGADVENVLNKCRIKFYFLLVSIFAITHKYLIKLCLT
jgi:hypothetical protein